MRKGSKLGSSRKKLSSNITTQDLRVNQWIDLYIRVNTRELHTKLFTLYTKTDSLYYYYN